MDTQSWYEWWSFICPACRYKWKRLHRGEYNEEDGHVTPSATHGTCPKCHFTVNERGWIIMLCDMCGRHYYFKDGVLAGTPFSMVPEGCLLVLRDKKL